MKKLLLIPIITILIACSSNTITMSVNESFTYDVKIKDNAEFILVKEGTSVEEFTNNLESYLDIDTNADSYTIDWFGESLSIYTREELEELDGEEISTNLSGMQSGFPSSWYETDEYEIFDMNSEIQASKEATLNYDSFRPIELIIDFTKDGETTTYYKQITLAVAREKEYNVISSNNITTMEEAYRQIAINDGIDCRMSITGPVYDYTNYAEISKEQGYFSNIRQK